MADYRKWDNVEVSNGRDDTHSNVDTPSLFGSRRQDTIQRMEEGKKELENHLEKKSEHAEKLNELKKKFMEAQANHSFDFRNLKAALTDVENEMKINQEEELQKKEKEIPSTVTTMNCDGFSKTNINSKEPKTNDQRSTEEYDTAEIQFIKDNIKKLMVFATLKGLHDSWRFLNSHGQLVCEYAAKHLETWCLVFEIKKKYEFFDGVAFHTVCLQQILTLAKKLDWHPTACLDVFYSRMESAKPAFKASFFSELNLFKQRIKKFASEKTKEATKEAKEKCESCLGPDLFEVLWSLPQELKMEYPFIAKA